MKKLSYCLWSSRSFAKLFSLLACVALGSLLAQQAVAQDFEFGWEPFPPSSWDGGWDASLKCIAVDGSNGTTTLTRNLTPGTDSVTQQGSVSCTFTDPGRTAPSCGTHCNSQGFFEETATCSLSLQFNNLTHSCSADNTLTVIGTCPTQPVTVGTINCEAGPGAPNPTFCGYAGNVPSGNESESCVWTLGYGKKIPPSNDVVGLGELCADVFLADENLGLEQNEVFKFAQKYTGAQCTGEFASLGPSKARYFHSDTWESTQLAFFNPSRPETRGTSSVQGQLIADTEYTGDTINGKCTPNNSGVITLTVRANPVETDQKQKPIAIEEIDQSTITVNKRGIIPGSCTFDKFPNPNVMTCKINRCVGGKSIIDETGIPGTNRATLEMRALMDTTPVVGDVETKKVVH